MKPMEFSGEDAIQWSGEGRVNDVHGHSCRRRLEFESFVLVAYAGTAATTASAVASTHAKPPFAHHRKID
jgi:hypothetical protein